MLLRARARLMRPPTRRVRFKETDSTPRHKKPRAARKPPLIVVQKREAQYK